MVAYSHLVGALQNAKFGKLTAADRMKDAAEKKLDLLENIADVGKLAEGARSQVRAEAKKQATENNDSEDNVYLEYQVVFDDEPFEDLGVLEGSKDECIKQIDEWKQGILEELEIEEQKIQMESDAANTDYTKFGSQEEALKSLITQEVQDYHTYGYQQ